MNNYKKGDLHYRLYELDLHNYQLPSPFLSNRILYECWLMLHSYRDGQSRGTI